MTWQPTEDTFAALAGADDADAVVAVLDLSVEGLNALDVESLNDEERKSWEALKEAAQRRAEKLCGS